MIASATPIQCRSIAINPSSAGKHVSAIENNIKTIKARVRTDIHALPFRLCRTLLVWLVLYCISHLNMEPTSTNTDDLSPREVFFQREVYISESITNAIFGLDSETMLKSKLLWILKPIPWHCEQKEQSQYGRQGTCRVASKFSCLELNG